MITHGINRKFRDIQRLQQILSLLTKYGFGYIVDHLDMENNLLSKKIVKITRAKTPDLLNLSTAERLRKILEELGPTFIKLGQILSVRPDLIPTEFCDEFEKLQNDVPAFDFEQVKEKIEYELKEPLGNLFSNFSVKPIAAASLSQVHFAELKTGEKIAVKVQRPGINKTLMADLDILRILAELAEKHFTNGKLYNPVKIVDEFTKTILREIDFTIEARNIEKFRRNFKEDDSVYIMKIFTHLSTKKILTMERIDGIKINKFKESKHHDSLDEKQIAINGADIIFKQIFTHGFFHADPHPGNIFILKNGQIAFLDFGMVGRISQTMKKGLSDILISIIDRNARGLVEAFVSMDTLTKTTDLEQLEMDLTDFVDNYYDIPLKDLKMEVFFPDIISIISQNHINIPSDFFLLSKVLITIEGIGKKLNPDFNAVIQTKPFVEELLKERYSPANLSKAIKDFVKNLYLSANLFPKNFTVILEKIKRGTLRIEFEHRGLENLIHILDKISNRI
ncbi:MAG: AarF/ABC1/UbiB kinase family protein, partial [Elusimicrobiales bacterium]|nr:AarF/ABC1/UbiB kinase family protein [Elusimicrobiales bacterium]